MRPRRLSGPVLLLALLVVGSAAASLQRPPPREPIAAQVQEHQATPTEGEADSDRQPRVDPTATAALANAERDIAATPEPGDAGQSEEHATGNDGVGWPDLLMLLFTFALTIGT